jgi:hypothetical protein
MANVTLTAGETGSPIVLSGNDEMFAVVDGSVEFSTAADTWFSIAAVSSPIVFTNGLTVTPRNLGSGSASFKHMPI